GGGALERVDSVAALGEADSLETTRVHEVFVADGGVQVAAHDSRVSEARLAFFRLGADGRLAYRYGYRLRAGPGLHNGEHRVRQAGGGKLAFYDRLFIPRTGDTRVAAALPALRREGAPIEALRPLVTPGRLHRPAFPVEWHHDPVIHAVTVCEPGDDGVECQATALYAPKGDVAHLSPRAAYVWGEHYDALADEEEEEDDDEDDEEEPYQPNPKVLYRLPLDGSPAAAVLVSGNPRDDRSITETGDGHVSVFVLHDGWTRASHSRLPVPALLRVAPGDFGDGRGTVPRARFRMVPNFPGPRHNRFVGGWLTYGNRPLDAYAASTGLFQQVRPGELGVGALRADGGGEPAWLPVGRGVEGLAPAGERAALVLCSCRDALQIALLRLGEAPRLTGWVPRAGVGHWEGEVLGVAYREDGPDAGLVGLPVGFSPEPFYWRATAAAFFRHEGDTLRSFGELRVRGDPAGNRDVVPFFAHGRVFALLGGDLVEAAEEGDRVRETRRISLP
ncbi:MAG TPA: hypothetical protein VHG91_00530, partial [Longimicrobium sp.]|nr:hypothetical protein [Longimicrobium sp.]